MVKNLPVSAGDRRYAGFIPGLGRSLGGGHGNPQQYSCLENPTDRGAWRATVRRVAKSQTRLKGLSHSSSSSIRMTVILKEMKEKATLLYKIDPDQKKEIKNKKEEQVQKS